MTISTEDVFAAFGKIDVTPYPCGCYTFYDVDRGERRAHRVCIGHRRAALGLTGGKIR